MFIEPITTVFGDKVLLIELQMIITSWAIVSMAGGGSSKVEGLEHQGEKEKSRPSHLIVYGFGNRCNKKEKILQR